MSLSRNAATLSAWLYMLTCLLLLAGCATNKKQDRVEQIEPDRSAGSAGSSQERPEPPRTATPKARPTPRAHEKAKKTPPSQEQAKIPPPAPPREESRDARQPLTPAQPQSEQARTDTPDEPKDQQQARIPSDRVTPLDQSGSTDDVEITRRIRQRLMSEDLSFSAKNVMIITEADRVVLKGMVTSPSEAERVKGVAGALTTKQIEDRLQISGQ